MKKLKRIAESIYSRVLGIRWKCKKMGARMLAKQFSEDYREATLSFFTICNIHKKGYSVYDWKVLGLDCKPYDEYLNTAEYLGMHPINGRFSAWIDDKLTIKYLLYASPLDEYMPKYYFQIDSNGKVLRLMDASELEIELEAYDPYDAIAELLSKKRELALKRLSGSIGDGFYKARFNKGEFYLNSERLSRDGFIEKVKRLKDYLITEYFYPHTQLSQYCPDTVNSIRCLIGRTKDGFMILKSFIRFGSISSGFVENYNAGGVLCYIDEGGFFKEGNILDKKTLENKVITRHPDSGKELSGKIPEWERIVKVCHMLYEYFPQLDYMGVDFCVTNHSEIKILEINSLASLDALQLSGSILKTSAGNFFMERGIKRRV